MKKAQTYQQSFWNNRYHVSPLRRQKQKERMLPRVGWAGLHGNSGSSDASINEEGILETVIRRTLRMWVLSDPATSLLGVHVREISTHALQVMRAGVLVEVATFTVRDIGANLGFITREVDKCGKRTLRI